jgi:hypothetical protein
MPYFRFEKESLVHNEERGLLKNIYKKYSKGKCYICDEVKFGRYEKVVYGKEFICVECVLSRLM